MGLESIVNVQISRQTAGVTQAGFQTPLILGPNKSDANVTEYASLAAVAEDFETSDAEYVLASKIFSQNPRLAAIKIGKTSTPVAQVDTLTPVVAVQAIHHYIATIDGVAYDFTGDADPTATEVVTGLKALINADTACKAAATGTTTLILTAKNAGAPFTVEINAFLTMVHTTPSNGIADDIQDAIDSDDDWYFLLTTAVDDTTVKVAAATIEAISRLYVFLNSDTDVRTNVTTDLVSELKALALFRTAVFYTGTAADRGDGGFVGRVAPLDPGSETWANKTIASLTVDNWTDGEQANLTNKNANHYVRKAGINVTRLGAVVGGEFIDVIRFIDWLTARMQEGIFGDIARLDKIPFTDSGIAIVESRMRSVLEAGVKAGGIVSYTVTVPKAKDISANDKALRILTGLSFTAVLAGAVHAAEINGTVTL